MINKIAVLGAGNGAFTFSGHLGLKGFDVSLFEFPSFEKNIEGIKEKGGIELTGVLDGFGKISHVTTCMKDALSGSEVVLVVVPAFVHPLVIDAALPYLEDGQTWVFIPGNFGSLLFKEALRKNNIKKNIKIADTASLLYSTRKIGPAKVRVNAVKKVLPIASLPGQDTGTVVETMKNLFDEFTPATNVLEIGFNNINTILHCPTAVLNLGRIEDTKGNFMFYWEGMTESVCKVMEKMDEERMAVGKALGMELPTTLFSLRQFYPQEVGTDLHDWVTHSKVHGGVGPDAPSSPQDRYIAEDVPNGLVPLSQIGDLLGIPTPAIDSIITLSSLANGVDYFSKGRTLDKLGLAGLTAEKIMVYIERGLL